MIEQIKQKIIFRSFRPWINEFSASVPSTTQSVIPIWYKEADRFAKNPITNEYYQANKQVCPFPKEGTTDDFGKIPTWKACPAIADAFSTGYVLKTPCDIEFYLNSSGNIDVKISDPKQTGFCTVRPPMEQFQQPQGYYKYHFAWMPDWGLQLPDGYSAIYMTPMNRFDLPFLNTTGVIDNDKVHISGSFPFFLIEGWTGVIPAGTPYMQLLPFKRENWESEIEVLSQQEMQKRMYDNMKQYRVPDGGIYKKTIWSRREYK